MDSEEFRKHAHTLVDFMADYLAQVGSRRVVPTTRPGEVRAALPTAAPEHGEPFGELFADFQRIVLPNMTVWQHPGFFAYFPANSSPPSVLAEMLTATLGAQCMSWQTSPAATELELTVMEWLRDMIGLPRTWSGVIQDSASSGTLVSLICARERATNGEFGRLGASAADAEKVRVYASTQAHSSVEKAAKLAGYGLDHLRKIPCDTSYRMLPEALEQAMAEDRARGLRPACVVASVGTTSTGAVDPVPAIADLCERHGAWLHVDAAWAGSAAICPEHRHLLDGAERADSLLFNPHKWLLTNFDCTAYFVRDQSSLVSAMATAPDYLKTAVDGQVPNLRDHQLQLGRRFRALKLWFVVRSYGVEGLRQLLRKHIDLAQRFAGWIQSTPPFELSAPPSLGLVCFRHVPVGFDARGVENHNQRLLERINAAGDVHLTHTVLEGRTVIRLSVGQLYTEARHVERAWQVTRDAAAALLEQTT
jgi:aromatic-L-amino-acid decarboxylase